MKVPQKIKYRTTYNPTITLLVFTQGIRKQELKRVRALLCFLHHYLQYHNMEATQVSLEKLTNEMIDVCIHTHTQSGVLLSLQKNETLPFAATWMELDSIILTEISQSEKDKYHTMSLLCGI